MTLKLVTSFPHLLMLARKCAEAEKTGDVDKIATATEQLESYKTMCLQSDQMLLGGMTYGELGGRV